MSIQLSRWLEDGVFQAIDDGYLESLTFAIYVKDPVTGKETTIENYTFNISQTKLPNGDDVTTINQVPLVSRAAMKCQARKYMKQLIGFASTLDTLPADRYVTMQLCYKDETPHAYEPLHFNSTFIDKVEVQDAGRNVVKATIGEINSNAACMEVEYNGMDDFSPYNFPVPLQEPKDSNLVVGDKDKVSFSSVKNLIIKNGRVTLSECSKVLSLSADIVVAAMDHMMKDGLVKNEAGYYCLNSTPIRSQSDGKNILDDVTPAQDSIEEFEDTQQHASKKRSIEKINNAASNKNSKKNKNQAAPLVLEKKVKKTEPIKKSKPVEKYSITKDPIKLKKGHKDGVYISNSQLSEV